MTHSRRLPSGWRRVALATMALSLLIPGAALGKAPAGFRTSVEAYITGAPGTTVIPLITVGEDAGVSGFTFEGIPDGIGIAPVDGHPNQMDVYVAHEQSTVPFRDERDHQDASVSRLRVDASKRNGPVITEAEVPLGPEQGYIRFCSSFMAGSEHGFDDYTLWLNEESNDQLARPLGQAGYAVALNTETGAVTPIPGMGRHNHENTVVIPGGWDELALMSGDDTFSAPSSQMYLYTAANDDAVIADQGTLWAFRVTHDSDGEVNAADAFNGANDYGDMTANDVWKGEFIRVPDDVADGTAPAWGANPQAQLENWSNENNVFQFIRIEDIAYDLHNPRVVYFADTGEPRAQPNAGTGRLSRGPSGSDFGFGNGRMFKFVMNADDPKVVDEFSILLDADTVPAAGGAFMTKPDNIDTSSKSLMVQEDADNAKIWQYSFASKAWSIVATVNDPQGESSGVVDASKWLGPGWWIVDVQAHGSDQEVFSAPGALPLVKREDGQLLLLRVPGS